MSQRRWTLCDPQFTQHAVAAEEGGPLLVRGQSRARIPGWVTSPRTSSRLEQQDQRPQSNWSRSCVNGAFAPDPLLNRPAVGIAASQANVGPEDSGQSNPPQAKSVLAEASTLSHLAGGSGSAKLRHIGGDAVAPRQEDHRTQPPSPADPHRRLEVASGCRYWLYFRATRPAASP
jgi:hypothetical protein